MNFKFVYLFFLLFLHYQCILSGKLLNTFSNIVDIPLGILKFLYQDFEYSQREFPETDIKNNSKFDFIIVGAGAAGCVLASRLSENENVTVLLVEAGGKENLIFDIPLAAFFNQIWPINYKFESEPSDQYCLGLKGHKCKYPQGQVMGGSTNLNFMLATRGNPHDYNHWAELGNTGWSYKDVLKYFKKLENFHNYGSGKEDIEYRGNSGPVNISFSAYHSDVAKAFVEAGIEMGYESIDYNGERQLGFSLSQTTTANGERVSANRAYLHPIKNRKNLFVSRHSLVTKISIDNKTKTAFGVTFKKKGSTYRVESKLETIVSAGALRSPQLLMVSGLGPADHLKNFNIPLVKDIPGVGKNFMNQMTYFGSIFFINDTKKPHTTFALMHPDNKIVSDYLNKRKGFLDSASGVEAFGFINLKNETARDGPVDTEIAFADVSPMFGDPLYHKVIGVRSEVYKKMFAKYLGRNAISLQPMLVKPKSRGEVLLSGNDIEDHPKIYPNYFSDPEDVEKFIIALRKTNVLANTRALQKFNVTLISDPVYGCENFTFDSDEYWNCSMRTLCLTLHHFSGTCKMGPSTDKKAVVNPKLQVIKSTY